VEDTPPAKMPVIQLGILCVTIFFAKAAEQRCASDKNQPVDASVISYCSDGIKNYSHIILDINNNQIIVAARSELSLLPYNLSSALVIRVCSLYTDRWMDGWMDEQTEGQTNRQTQY
jgi:hypothetical protein